MHFQAHVYVKMYKHLRKCVYWNMYMCTYAHMLIYIPNVLACVHVHAWTYMLLYLYMYLYVYAYA